MVDRHLVDVHVLLVGGAELLLSQRRDPTPEFDGKWHLPSGKLDAGESVVDAAGREVAEEVGIAVQPVDLRLVHTAHVTAPDREPRIGLFFETRRWRGEPTNLEPDKCSGLRWFALDDLPDDIIGYPATGIRGYREDIPFSTLGWPGE